MVARVRFKAHSCAGAGLCLSTKSARGREALLNSRSYWHKGVYPLPPRKTSQITLESCTRRASCVVHGGMCGLVQSVGRRSVPKTVARA